MNLHELTRDRIAAWAPDATVVLPTASIEQHGPHLPIVVDTLLCTTVAMQATARATGMLGPHTVFVAPTFSWGNSHHHRPFAGVLSLASPHYQAALTDVVESLYLCGFRRILILNGHGGNTAPNTVVAQDFVHRLGHRVHIVAAAYWDIGRAAIVAADLVADSRIPGHAGEFETALMQAIRPDLVSAEGMEKAAAIKAQGEPSPPLSQVNLETHGAWVGRSGYTDEPHTATAEQGRKILEILVDEVAQVLVGLQSLALVE